MENSADKGILIKVSYDKMTAAVRLLPPHDQEIYTEQQIYDALEQKGIVYGYLRNEIRRMVTEELYSIEVEAARGKPPVNGEKGYYVYFFETENIGKPKILSNGTVDYMNISAFVCVKEGELLAQYVEATEGEAGTSVYGQDISPRKGADLLPLRGNGLVFEEEEKRYYAEYGGKIELHGNKIVISKVYEIRGDVDLASGNVDFDGDVIIRGGVMAGFSVKATKNVEISGNVEAAKIIAGENILLKSGMQGNGKGLLEAGGSITGKFFEACTLKAKGNLEASSLLNSTVSVDGYINISGNYSLILGGITRAVKGINGKDAGNRTEVTTYLEVGISEELAGEHSLLEEETQQREKDLAIIQQGLDMLVAMERGQKLPYAMAYKKESILQTKIIRQAEIRAARERLDEIASLRRATKSAKIILKGHVFPGCCLKVNGFVHPITVRALNITVSSDENGIVVR